MPTDTRSRTTTKPLTPALSSNLRSRPVHGLTPRLAGAGPASPVSAPPRTLRQQTLSPDRNEEEGNLSLNSNITPRSGARISRIDTESPSTPDTATRSRIPEAPGQADSGRRSHGLGITSPAQTPTHPRPKSTDQLSFLPTANGRRISGASTASSAKDDSRFFRADDVKGTPTSTKPTSARSKTVYLAQTSSPRISPKKFEAEAESGPDEKFFYASNPLGSASRAPKSSLAMKFSTASSAASSTRSLPIYQQLTTSSVRSPVASVAATPPEAAPADPLRPRAPSTAHSTATSATERRRSSSLSIQTSNETKGKHQKSLSANSTTNPPATHMSLADTSERGPHMSGLNQIPPLDTTAELTPPDSLSPKSSTLTSTNAIATALTNMSATPSTQAPRPPMLSRHTRGSSEATAIQPITKQQLDAAANARRERKVLDLEISNSSLLAINRALEKELRKQNTELRRFRRLSRSGRLSFTPANRIVSGASMSTLATLDEDGDLTHLGASPGSSSPTDPASDDDYPTSEEDTSSSFTESSDALRRRARDEKRLMQDLKRHQEILIDSQKLSQSIQRCLNCTEELIRDGKKALSYQVEANEVPIGGRVLHHDDDEALSEVDFDEYREGMAESRQGLLSPTISKHALEEAAMWVDGLQKLVSPKRIAAPMKIVPELETVASPVGSPSLDGAFSPVMLPAR